MRIQHALWVSGRARGVADGGGGAFVEGRPRELLALRRDQGFVAVDIRNAIERRHYLRVAHAYPRPDIGAKFGNAGNQRREARIKKEYAVFRVVQDVDQLFEMQARIQGVDDQTAAGHGVINLDVPVIVPSEGTCDRSSP